VFTAKQPPCTLAAQTVQERRKWQRFGDATKEVQGEMITVRAVEDIPFDRVRLQKQTQEEKKSALDLQTALATGDKAATVTKCVHVPVVCVAARAWPIPLALVGQLRSTAFGDLPGCQA
jgi:Eukaryotic translation initiation factor 3 subunit G